MVDGKRVAVVVPAHDEERLIGTTLAGIPEFVDRILVVDDGSRDGTADAVRTWSDPRVELVEREHNGGVGAAIVTGYQRALEDRLDEREQVGRVHLVVGRHHADDVEALLERPFVAGDDRGADAAVPLPGDQLDSRVCRRAHGLGGPVGRGVVDDEDPVDELGDPGEGRPDQPLLVVGGDDDRNALPVDHRPRRCGRGVRGTGRRGAPPRSRGEGRSTRRRAHRCGRCGPSS